ncbi:hypothetical protein VBJFXLJN_CDS_0010 [Pseudomonas phage TIVP-H6]
MSSLHPEYIQDDQRARLECLRPIDIPANTVVKNCVEVFQRHVCRCNECDLLNTIQELFLDNIAPQARTRRRHEHSRQHLGQRYSRGARALPGLASVSGGSIQLLECDLPTVLGDQFLCQLDEFIVVGSHRSPDNLACRINQPPQQHIRRRVRTEQHRGGAKAGLRNSEFRLDRADLLFRCDNSEPAGINLEIRRQFSSQSAQSVFAARAAQLHRDIRVSEVGCTSARPCQSLCGRLLATDEALSEAPLDVICGLDQRGLLHSIRTRPACHSAVSKVPISFRDSDVRSGVCLCSTVFNNERHYAPPILEKRPRPVSSSTSKPAAGVTTAARST